MLTVLEIGGDIAHPELARERQNVVGEALIASVLMHEAFQMADQTPDVARSRVEKKFLKVFRVRFRYRHSLFARSPGAR